LTEIISARHDPMGGGQASEIALVESIHALERMPMLETAGGQRKQTMDDKDLHARGLKLRVEMFGSEAVEKRMTAFGDFGKPLQHIINAYAYGDVWQRSALPPATKSLAMVAMMAAAGHPNELRVHLKGAVKNGCSAEQIQEVLLLLTLYCGIPAANEAHRIAAEVLREDGKL
jgi:4-carboxymuconolactone decarboxylase